MLAAVEGSDERGMSVTHPVKRAPCGFKPQGALFDRLVRHSRNIQLDIKNRRKARSNHDYRRPEGISQFQFATRILQYGWKSDEVKIDNGRDLIVEIIKRKRDRHDFPSTGAYFAVQLKSTDDLNSLVPKRKSYVKYGLAVKNLLEWDGSMTPVVIVVWDVQQEQGVWITASEAIRYLDLKHDGWRQRGPDQEMPVRIPLKNTTDDRGLDALKIQLAPVFITQALSTRDLAGGCVRFSIPISDRKKVDEYESRIAHGTPLTLDTSQILEFTWPEILDDFYGDLDIIWQEFQITDIPLPIMHPLSFEFETANGKRVSFPYLNFSLIRGGRDTFTISNEQQIAPVHFTMIVPTPEFAARRQKEAHLMQPGMTFKFRTLGSNVIQTRELLSLIDLIEQGGILRITFHEKGDTEHEFPLPAGKWPTDIEPLTPTFREFIDNLCTIQQEVDVRFKLPEDDNEVTIRDYRLAAKIANFLNTGEVVNKHDRYVLSLLLDPDHAKAFLEATIELVNRGQPIPVCFPQVSEDITILGKTFNLGTVDTAIIGFVNMKPADYAEFARSHKVAEQFEVELIRVQHIASRR